MFCNHCGMENSNNDIYCKGCGTLLQQNNMQNGYNPMQHQQQYAGQAQQPYNQQQPQQNYDYNQQQNYYNPVQQPDYSQNNTYYQNNNQYINNDVRKYAILSVVIPAVLLVIIFFWGAPIWLWAPAIAISANFSVKGRSADEKLYKIGLVLSCIVVGIALISIVINVMTLTGVLKNEIKEETKKEEKIGKEEKNSDNKASDSKKENNKEEKTETKFQTQYNSKVVELFNKLEADITLEEANKVIGFEGTLDSDSLPVYEWKVSDESSIRIQFSTYDEKAISMTMEVDTSEIKNKNVDFSKIDEVKEKAQAEGLTYDEVKSYFGNVDGVIIEKSDGITRYIWVDEEESYIRVSFYKSTGKTASLTGMIK